MTKKFVPIKDENYVSCDKYSDIKRIINSNIFMPFLITGPTGAGKTKTVEQVHCNLNKELYRVNITSETDEDSLMGGFRLKDGETYFDKGPVIQAMEAGATLLIDEIDLGSPNKIMCLQSVLEGVGYLIKRTGEWVEPKSGFNIVATANTKMSGDVTGNFVGTQILNDALRDRFIVTMEYSYASPSQEKRIINSFMETNDIKGKYTEGKIDHLISWVNKTRGEEEDENMFDTDAAISTRRLIGILTVDLIFNDLEKSIRYGLSKFDSSVVESFLEYYRITDPGYDEEIEEEDETEEILY